MYNSRLLKTLRQIPKEDLTNFPKYVKALYPKRTIDITVLDYIMDYAPNFNERNALTNESAYLTLFSKEPNKRPKKSISNASASLFTLLEEFFLWQDPKEDNFERQYRLAKIFKKKKLDELFFRSIDSLEKELNKDNPADMASAANKLKIGHIKYYHVDNQKISEKTPLINELSILDNFYIVTKLKYCCELFNHTKILNSKSSELLFLEPIIQYLEKAKPEQVSPLSLAYYHAMKLIRDIDYESFNYLKSNFRKTICTFEKEDQCILLSYMINYNISKFRGNSPNEHKDDILETIKLGLEFDLHSIKDSITPTRFINIIEMCCFLDEPELNSNFINRYSTYLKGEKKENAINFGYARIKFHEKDFGATLSLLNKTVLNNIFFKIREKELKIRSLYETWNGVDATAISSCCEAFSKQVSRETALNADHKEAFINFSRITAMLVNKKKDKEGFLRHVKQKELLYLRNWIIEKIKEIKP